MKIIYFNNERKVLRTLEHVLNPVFYGLHEIRWDDGGDALSEDNEFYLIVEDDVDFKTIAEEEFVRQYKEQAKFELVKRLERNRMFYLVEDNYDEKVEEFKIDKETIESKTSIEELKIFMNEVKNRPMTKA
jgi:hypothetical protein